MDKDQVVDNVQKPGYEVVSCHDEHTLLSKFLYKYYEIQPTIITGWNIDFFDIPYLANRIKQVCGEDKMRELSPWKNVSSKQIYSMGRNHLMYDIMGCLLYTSPSPRD